MGLCAPKKGAKRNQFSLTWDDIHYTEEPPVKTDAEAAAPLLETKEEFFIPGKRMTRKEMKAYLLGKKGHRCQGCDRPFDDDRYLELDHNAPKSDGGPDHIKNRILLCGPCNRLKSNTLTLSGLRKRNKELGYMHNPSKGE